MPMTWEGLSTLLLCSQHTAFGATPKSPLLPICQGCFSRWVNSKVSWPCFALQTGKPYAVGLGITGQRLDISTGHRTADHPKYPERSSGARPQTTTYSTMQTRPRIPEERPKGDAGPKKAGKETQTYVI